MQLEAFLPHFGFAVLLVLLSAGVVRLMIAYPMLDDPARRAATAHTVPTPRGGGLGIVAAFVVGMVVLYGTARFARIAEPEFIGTILAAIAIAGVALADDLMDFRFIVKLAAQTGAALVAMASGLVLTRLALPWVGVVDLGLWGPLLTLFWIIACTNAVNFMDGMDGLVGGSLLVVCASLCFIGAQQEAWFVYAAALFLSAGLLGFLPYNLHPARIFMGDVGSQFLGFILAVLAVACSRFDTSQLSFLIVPLLLFAHLFDTGFTLIRRVLMGERPSTPHRTHLYQLAQRSGMSVRQVTMVHGGFVLFQAMLALAFPNLDSDVKPLVVLPPLVVQLIWLAYVARRVRHAGLSWRAG
ncbi:glycosyltransferase family 4 protein [Roseomonas xinghualingensis]|uniref:glycosyltransferase family 4 protein n=1 Tax=Roseomonas xinghualingensis TaxID=2986475 RepID=UPI0021F20878|nr:MraY family glycosyltransferase [Roseomonas sp. SXEYE001]MCV4208237.1 undecaprenyl/decaprenyl-phosphate alpha-N-acetylglucosaminyl 1-phosphate transferase [Roseomonas sp. SXEYE001]